MAERLSRLRSWFTNWTNWKRIVIPLLLIAGLFILGRVVDVDKYLQIVQEWAWKLGPWGPVAYVGIYVLAMLLLLPGTPFTILAAFLFGALWGYVTMVAATTVAAVTAFFIARYLAREAVEKRFAGTETFELLKEMVEQNLWFAIPFIRLMPVFPFAINNYALGLTHVSFWSYIIASEIIFLPMNAVLVLGAGTLYRAMVKGEVSWILLGLTSGAGLLVLIFGYVGKKIFGKSEKPGGTNEGPKTPVPSASKP